MKTCAYCPAQISCRRPFCDRLECRQAWQREYNQTRRPRAGTSPREFICATCGKAFSRPPTKGQLPRYCPEHAAGRGWKQTNLGSRRRSDAKRRAAKAIDAETFEPVEIFERDRWRCGICHRVVDRRLSHPHPMSPSLDHIIPLAEGGNHVRANARLTHLRCNLSRGARGGNEQLLLIG